jgi:hypothetical protein
VKVLPSSWASCTSDVSLNSTGNCSANRRMKPYAERVEEFVQPEPSGIDLPEGQDAGRYRDNQCVAGGDHEKSKARMFTDRCLLVAGLKRWNRIVARERGIWPSPGSRRNYRPSRTGLIAKFRLFDRTT